MQPLMTKRDVLDRYSQHTMQCKHCKEVRSKGCDELGDSHTSLVRIAGTTEKYLQIA
jgi:hypothetical protein